MSRESKLAILGGEPYRSQPFPKRTPFGKEEIAFVIEAIQSQSLFGLGGPKVTKFERAFAKLYNVEYSVASTSGTAAIHIAIGMIDPNPGDEIITAPITDGGSIVPIVYQNCIPVFADVDESYNMNPKDVEAKITERTAAIMVVHLFGNSCDMKAMLEISSKHNIPLIEDASQAHVTKYRGKYLGTLGDIGAFSLQQSKHMTTGDGGMAITNREDLAERMSLFRDKGWTRKPDWGPRTYLFLAPNYRMTELQAAVGLAQIGKVQRVVEKRRALGNYLSELISDVEGVIPAPITEGSEHSYWLYPLRVERWRINKFAKVLKEEGIDNWLGYIGEPIFLCMDALAAKRTFGNSRHPFDGCHGGRSIEYAQGMCPVTENMLHHLLTISINENYSKSDIEYIAGAIHKVAELLPQD